MKYRLIELLVDPSDGSRIRVVDPEVQSAAFDGEFHAPKCSQYCAFRDCAPSTGTVSPLDCKECYSTEIVSGSLVSESGNRYPITKGIPRLLSRATGSWIKNNQDTFSLEWRMFRFGERNWGQDINVRRELFLKGTAKTPNELKGQLMVDAGCGSGLLSMHLADTFDMEMLAFDLAYGIEQAYEHNTNPFVYFVQASVLEPPVRAKIANLVYCAGVLVAIPNARIGFNQLIPLLSAGGRFLIWMYHPIDEKHHPNDLRKMRLYNWIRANVTSRLPISVQQALFLAAIPPFVVKRSIERLVGRNQASLTWREKMQGFTDMFSPVFQHRFDEEEIARWFRESDLVNVAIAYQEEYGFAVRGDNEVAQPALQNFSKPITTGKQRVSEAITFSGNTTRASQRI